MDSGFLPGKNKKIGLALGGGAGLGWSHIGVVRYLQENNISISMVSGTSIGAIVGACLAADLIDHLEDLARSIKFKDMIFNSDPSFKRGSVLGARRIDRIFHEHFGDLHIEDLRLPFAAMASDLYTGEGVILNKGHLVTAIKASSAVPGMLPPVKCNNRLLVDGGMTDPIPTKAVWDMGADFVIAVDLQGNYASRAKRLGLEPGKDLRLGSAIKIARASLFLTLSQLGQSKMNEAPPSMVIRPSAGHVEAVDFTKAHELIKIGYQAAAEAFENIENNIEACI